MDITSNQVENSSSLDRLALVLLVGFLFWGHLRTTLVTSIPSLLFVYLIVKESHFVKEILIRNWQVLSLIGGAFLFATIFSALPLKSIKGVYDFSRGMIVLVPICWAVRRHPVRLEKYTRFVLVASIFASCVIAVLASQSGTLDQQRVLIGKIYVQYGTFGTSAGVLCLAAVAFALLFAGESRKERCFWWGCGAVSFSLILYSGSRGSLLATLVALVILLGLTFHRQFYAICIAGVTFSCGFLYLLKTNCLGVWIESLNRPGDFSSYRFDIYSSLLRDWWEQGFFLGFGPNTFKFLEYGQVQSITLMMPHNIYFEALTSLGAVSFFFFLLSQWCLYKRIDLKLVRQSSIAMLGASLLAFFLVRYAFDQKFWSTFVPGSIFFCYGLLGLFDRPAAMLPTGQSTDDNL